MTTYTKRIYQTRSVRVIDIYASSYIFASNIPKKACYIHVSNINIEKVGLRTMWLDKKYENIHARVVLYIIICVMIDSKKTIERCTCNR